MTLSMQPMTPKTNTKTMDRDRRVLRQLLRFVMIMLYGGKFVQTVVKRHSDVLNPAFKWKKKCVHVMVRC